MSEGIRQEAAFFAVSLTVGMLLVVEYLLLAGVRRLIRHSDLAVNLEDFFYWCNAALVIFIAVFRANDGAIRLYSAAAVILGAWCLWGVASFLRRICIKLLKKFRNRGKMT